jgi:hypothetical protein
MKPLQTIITAFLLLGLLSGASLATTNVATALVIAPQAKPEFQHLKWKNKTIKIAVSNSLTRFSSNIKSDSDVLGAIRRSLQAWSNVADVDLQFEISDRQSVSPSGPAGDGVSLITIAQTAENILFFSKDADSASAKTRIFFNRKGVITEADIVLNPYEQFSTDGTYGTFDLESTLTHEIGHLLGLHHSAVLGATMAESFAKNGTMGLTDFGPRTLAESDIAAIRELYGARAANAENCCGTISGRLTTLAGRPGKGLQVWAEEMSSGRVGAQADTALDGTFRIGGVAPGEYLLYWKTKDPSLASSMGEIGNVTVDLGENKAFNEKIVPRSAEINLQYLGVNGQLADYGITLNSGRSYLINLGGKNLDPKSVKISFATQRITSQMPITPVAFGEGVSGINFLITIDPDITPGQYSIFASDENGAGAALVGALNIE